MDVMGKRNSGIELKIFDPRDPSTGLEGTELLDASVVKRGNRWWMYLAGQVGGYGATDIYSASLPEGAPLSATGWELSKGSPPPETGLWWCASDTPSASLTRWGEPVQIMTAEDRGWHSGPWKPSFQSDQGDDASTFVFFDGSYRTDDPGPFPFAFTLGCLVTDL
jgi:hypothetical protein